MIPTAREFLKPFIKDPTDTEVELLIAFAKLHVEACKKETKKAAYVRDPITGCTVYCSSHRLNNAYPLSKIK